MTKDQERQWLKENYTINIDRTVVLDYWCDVWWEVEVDGELNLITGGMIDPNEDVSEGLVTIWRGDKKMLVADIVWDDSAHFHGQAIWWAYPKYGEEPND